jgi:hypothetical protein
MRYQRYRKNPLQKIRKEQAIQLNYFSLST